MNKYLLLRDNKQSGPYTVPEIISKGIKPYDLVWLDGKSAAWRYPSEIEELKAYAPVVEEQPFDRFYKKPEFSLDVKPEVAKAEGADISAIRFQPKVTSPEPVSNIDHTAVKKVYINFPGATKREDKVTPVAAQVSIEKEEKPFVPSFKEEMINESHFSSLTPISTRKTASERNLLFVVVAACFILIMVIGVLIVNYMNQRSNLDHLNLLVQQMEQRQKEKQEVVPAVVKTQQLTPAVIPPSTETTPATTVDYNVQGNVAVKPAKKSIPLTPEDPSVKFTPGSTGSNTAIPQTGSADNTIKPAVNKEVASENLFSQVSVKANKFKTGLLGGISNLQIELTNNSKRELHKVAVQINFLGPEKKVVKTQTIYFENVSPGMQSTIDVPRSNRGVTVTYTISDIKS